MVLKTLGIVVPRPRQVHDLYSILVSSIEPKTASDSNLKAETVEHQLTSRRNGLKARLCGAMNRSR